MLITTIVLAVVVVFCGGGAVGAYFLVKNAGGKGQATPVEAVQGFLEAVFHDQDVDKAIKFVCSEARDKSAIAKKIGETKAYQQKGKNGSFTWPSPVVDKEDKTKATLTVPVKFSTSDEKVAEKRFKFTVVKSSGWWVCDVGDAT